MSSSRKLVPRDCKVQVGMLFVIPRVADQEVMIQLVRVGAIDYKKSTTGV